ncbi:hypothetical protein Sjap_023889 [Stephania japonica]|uniref:DUF2428 domain-containing protein n=1 Tax=Stephania japonica TaxID=461633 RepID=A0AAP0EFM9_9MAGN
MSAKWRALQHRHRYTYTAIVAPLHYTERLSRLPSNVSSLNLFLQLKELISLNSVYSQVDHAKKVASAFAELLANGEESAVSEGISMYLEILFIENSLPLHRTMLSALAKARKSHPEIADCFRRLCDEYGVFGRKGKRFCVSRVALSLMNCPKLGFLAQVVEDCSVLAALDIAVGLSGMVREVSDGSRPSPVVMEQCQEALSCLYYLLQRFPSKFINVNCHSHGVIPEGHTILEFVVGAVIGILKSSAFSRDSLVAAGVSFFAALQVHLKPQELSFFIVKFFPFHTSREFVISGKSGKSLTLPFKGDLLSEIGKFSALSRLCLLRGILTAVPRAVISGHFDLVGDTNNSCVHVPNGDSVWTILCNGILPELCDYCESPIDAHFNFHVLTVMQICLQQLKTSLSSGLVFLSDIYNPLPEDIGSRILRIIWNNLEDPLSQTVKQVHLIFDLFLDIQASLQSVEKGGDKNKSFLRKIASDLLSLGPRCKGRYVPLASLTKRLGAKYLLQMNVNLLFETIYAYIDDDVCCAATSFLKCFLECLRDESWTSDGIEKGYMVFRGLCLPPLMHGLVSGIPKLRSNLNTYALSVMLEVDVDSIFPMLNFISCTPNGVDNEFSLPELETIKMSLTVDQLVSALVSLLKVSRSLALIEGDIDLLTGSVMVLNSFGSGEDNSNQFAVVRVKNIEVKVCLMWLVLALTHVDETLRIDAAESLFLNPKTSSLPSHLELRLLKEAVPLNMRCCSTAFQMKWTSLFRKFFSRVRTALERQFKQGHWQPLVSVGRNGVDVTMGTNENPTYKAEALFHFMKWLSCFLFFSCYPSAPYERKIMAMELTLTMFSTWSIVPTSQASTSASCLYPYSEGFISPDSTLLLVGSIIDSWDRLRESAFRILLQFPTPLPGILSQEQVRQVIEWVKMSVCSPRVRESDAGALTLRLIFRKYVLELGWFVGDSVKTVCFDRQSKLLSCSTETSKSKFPVIEYILSLIDWLHASVEEGEKDLSEACKNSFVHGVLLSLRYTFEELDWNSDIVLSITSEMRNALGKLLELVMRITSLALWVVSADAWYLPDDTDDMVGEDALLSDMPVETTVPRSSLEQDIKDLNAADSIRPEQVVMVGCWLAMKEISLLLGTITRKIPLPSCSSSDSIKCSDSVFKELDISSRETPDNILDFEQLEAIGSHFLEVLLKMKHNGAIDKTRAGFTALCNRLLCSNDPRLCQMTESWMDQLMERTIAKGQTVDDLLRRSAGIPAAFIALFLSEPEGTPKKLLPRALRWLIDVANTSLHTKTEANLPNNHVSQHTLNDLSNAPILALSNKVNVNEKTSKLRDEGVIPTVHAFNVLRAAFNDTNLATDTSGFSAEALIISIRSFSSPFWEVRNSACLAYTALVRRMIGFLNVQKRESARRALTAVEFFHRYPSTHSFMYHELKIATEFLGDGKKDLGSNLAMVVHPSLCPVLILLSRLKPSPINSDAEDGLDPFLFMPLIRLCSMQNNFRVRVLASRALSGLVSNEKLPTVLFNIASELPWTELSTISSGSVTTCEENRTASFNSIHGMLLQLGHLLDVNCRDLVDTPKKDLILGTLIQVFIKCSWIGRPRSCPCSILNCLYIQVLDHMFVIARACKMSIHVDAIRSLLVELSLECLDTKVCHELSFYDPAKAELRRQAAVSYFNCSLCARVEEVNEGFQMLQEHYQSALQSLDVSETECGFVEVTQRLIHLVSDKSYEVRSATLKWLLGILKTIPLGGSNAPYVNDITNLLSWARTNLQPTLIQLLSTENNSRCTSYIMRILFIWNKMQFQKPQSQLCHGTIYVGSMGCDDVLLFWDKLISLNNVFRHQKVQEGLICCMGLCVKKFISLFRNSIFLDVGGKKIVNFSAFEDSDKWVLIYKCIGSFISVIGQRSDSSEPVNMRKAAANSMVASGLLEEAGYIYEFVANTCLPSEEPCNFKISEAANIYGCRILDTWFTCIKLLEDEDVGLREDLAKEVQKCFALKKIGSSHQVDAATVPKQVEKVIESSFEFLSSVFGHWLWYFEYLVRYVLNTTSYMWPQGDLVRRVFDKEIDNHHEEKLLLCQFCCMHLETLPMSASWAVGLPDSHEVATVLHKWRKRFYDQLISFSEDHMKVDDRVDWIGGAGNHKDVFISLYASLLGLYALSQCLFLREIEILIPQFKELIDLGKIMKPYLNNPVLYNMYWLVLQSHRKISDVAIDSLELRSGDCLIWEGFDPYFLLR